MTRRVFLVALDHATGTFGVQIIDSETTDEPRYTERLVLSAKRSKHNSFLICVESDFGTDVEFLMYIVREGNEIKEDKVWNSWAEFCRKTLKTV